MRCLSPITANGSTFACQQCTPCKIKRGQIWSIRQILEAKHWSHVPGRNTPLFVTLTYRDEHLTYTRNGYQTLNYSDYQKFEKRLRKHGIELRRVVAGEYGSETQRPHFHAILFGVDEVKLARLASKFTNTQEDKALYRKELRLNPAHLEGITKAIHHIWGLGRIDIQPVMKDAYGYVAGYVTKNNHTQKGLLFNSPYSDDDRVPEFSHSSRNPPIGCYPELIEQIASKLLLIFERVRKDQGQDIDQEQLLALFSNISDLARQNPNFAEESISILHQDGTLMVNDLLLFFGGYMRYEKKLYPMGRTLLGEVYKKFELTNSGIALVRARQQYHQVKELIPMTEMAVAMVIDQVDQTDKNAKRHRKHQKASKIGKKSRGNFHA